MNRDEETDWETIIDNYEKILNDLNNNDGISDDNKQRMIVELVGPYILKDYENLSKANIPQRMK